MGEMIRPKRIYGFSFLLILFIHVSGSIFEEITNYAFDKQNCLKIMTSNSRLFATSVFGIIFAIGMFLGGIIWCLERCSCYAKFPNKPSAKVCASIQNVLIVLMLILAILSMIWFFTANRSFSRGTDQLPKNIGAIFNDMEKFINDTRVTAKIDLTKELNVVIQPDTEKVKKYLSYFNTVCLIVGLLLALVLFLYLIGFLTGMSSINSE